MLYYAHTKNNKNNIEIFSKAISYPPPLNPHHLSANPMQPIKTSPPRDAKRPRLSFGTSNADSKNSSISVGGGYSSTGGWNVNATYTRRW
jgi:hypothetical protein